MLHVVHTRVHTKERAYHEHPLRTYSTENCFALIVISLSLARWNVPLLISGRLLAVCSAHGIRYIRLICRANENRLQERRFWDVKLDRVSRNFLRNSLSRWKKLGKEMWFERGDIVVAHGSIEKGFYGIERKKGKENTIYTKHVANRKVSNTCSFIILVSIYL